MTSTITIRLTLAQRAALKKRASALRKSEAALLRELVERETMPVSPADLAAKWGGSLDSGKAKTRPNPLKAQLRARNWRA